MNTKPEQLTKQQMCNVINSVRGYAMTPDVWTRDELLSYLIDGACWYSYLNNRTQKTFIFG